MPGTRRKRLLVFNSHEAWVHQLSALDYDLDIVVGLAGRYTTAWDTRIRPIPANARPIGLAEAQNRFAQYDCTITHNLTDLLDIKCQHGPKILVLHLPIEARQAEERSQVSQAEMQRVLGTYISLVGVHVVAVSAFKGKSWGFDQNIVPFGFDVEAYPPCSGNRPCALRVCNFALRRKTFLLWDFHEMAFQGLPVRIVGHNPEMPSVTPSQNWDHMKRLFQTHRFYIHTAHPELEDGYNMASIEAMAAGLPVLGNCHPTSPVQHGISGFLSDDPRKLRDYAKLLLDNRQLALNMGVQAKKTASDHFSLQAFQTSMEASIQIARQTHQAGRAFLQPVQHTKPKPAVSPHGCGALDIVALPPRKRRSMRKATVVQTF